MPRGFDNAKRVMSGTHGHLWLDGEEVAEIAGFQAKVSLEKEEVPMAGVMWSGHKVKGISGKGTVRLHKVNSRMMQLIGNKIRSGQDPRFVIMSKLDDPDAYGAERVCVKDVSFDDLTLADWELKSLAKIECPFTFGDYELMDMVD